MADVQVTCITRSGGTHAHITHLGGAGWFWTTAQVIQSIEAGTNSFYTLVGGKRANVGVVQSGGSKYLQTHADGSWNNNLLSLPSCS